MEFTVTEQALTFLLFCALGFLMGIFYDFSKSIKNLFKPNKKTTALIDLVFLVVAVVFLCIILFKHNGLSLRIFYFLGMGGGLILYFNSISNALLRIFNTFLAVLLKFFKILLYPFIILCKIVNIILRVIFKLFKKIHSHTAKIIFGLFESLKKLIKRRKKI